MEAWIPIDEVENAGQEPPVEKFYPEEPDSVGAEVVQEVFITMDLLEDLVVEVELM